MAEGATAGAGRQRVGALLEEALRRRGAGVMVVGAHPDDESFALGGHLPRLPRALVVIATDGAPRDLRDAGRLGFADAASYAERRRGELLRALELAAIPPGQVIALGVPDQQAVFHVAEIARRLAELVGEHRCWLVLTHSYEGGHPDHDAVACAVQAACDLLRQKRQTSPAVIEMPYYRVAGDAVVQALPDGDDVLEIVLDETAYALKQAMLAQHVSQQRLLGSFVSRVEQFRPAPRYRFDCPANGGRLLYEQWQLGTTGEAWLVAAAAALAELGMA